MTTRDLIQVQLDRLGDDELERVYRFIEAMRTPAEVKPSASGLMAKLRKLEVAGPEDFAENVDRYLNEAHHDSANLP